MRVISNYLLLVSVFVSTFLSAQEIGFPIIRNYTPKEYNSAPQVWSVVQDTRGIMYFSTNSGNLLEYDGVSWRTILIDNASVPYELAMDKSGKVYIGASGEFGYLAPGKTGNTEYRSLTYLLNDSAYKIGDVRFIKFTSTFVYFLTYDAILQYNPKKEKLSIFKADDNGRFLGDFVYNDIYYVRLSKKGLMKIEHEEIKEAVQPEFFKDRNTFRVALPYSTNTLLIPTRTEGIYLYQPENNIPPQAFPISKMDFIAGNDIYNAALFQRKYFITGSLNKGAILLNYQGKVLQQFNEGNLLQNNSIYDVTADTNQNIWLSLANGISKTEPGFDLSYRDKKAGLNGTVLSIIRFHGTVYIATDAKLYFIDSSNQLQEVKNIPVGQNWSFLEFKTSTFTKGSNDDLLLLGTTNGIFEIKGNMAFQIYKGSSHAFKIVQSVKNPLRVFSPDYPDFISIRFEKGNWVSEGKWEGISENIRGIMEDENGDIWLGTLNNGAIRVTPDIRNITKPKKVRSFTMKDGLPSLKDVIPFKYRNKIIWGTEKGLYSYNSQSDRFEPFCELGEQFCNGSRDIYSLREMPDGKIWIYSEETKNADIGYLQPGNNGGYSWVFAPFRRIPEMYLEAFYAEPSGVVWLGGSEGLFRYDMSKDTKNYKQSFNCLIRKVSTIQDSVLYGGNESLSLPRIETLNELSYKFNTLKFEFAAPFFDHEEKTLYSYQLIGFDKEWSKWDRQSQKEYTNLSEGTYTFRVKALNVYDVESTAAEYQIKILPPFYRTWWAYAIYFILSVFLIFIIVKLYTKSLIKQKERLKNTVEEKTREVLFQKEELEAINEELISSNEELYNQREELESTLNSLQLTQKQLIQSEKMASLGILASGVAHEINNPLNFIQSGIEGIETNLNKNNTIHNDEITTLISAIKVGVSRAAAIVTSLNHYSRQDKEKKTECNIHEIIDNCLIMLNNQIKNRIVISKNYENKRLLLIGNDSELHQAILNILSNSVQAIDNEGTIKISTLVENNVIKIAIEDSGSGINPQDLPKIFDPFFTTKDPGKGTGLGLSITYNIIKEHNGIIEFQSQFGKGTIVLIKLPINNTVKT